MQNYRTTLVGASLAGLTFVSQFQSNGGNLADWRLWVIPFLIAVLGYVAKDAGVTGTAKILIGCLALLTLPSCQSPTIKNIGAALTTPKAKQVELALTDLGLHIAVNAGKLSEGDALSIGNGVAVVTSSDNTISKVVKLSSIGLDVAAQRKLISPGDNLLIKTTTAVITQALAPATPITPLPAVTTGSGK